MVDLPSTQRAREYALRKRIVLDFDHPLGAGIDGEVWRSNRNTGVKVVQRQHNYHLELESYQRLGAAGVRELRGFSVPELVDFDDELLVVEMTIVSPPFILDFGKVHFDRRPEFSAETLAEWRESMQELMRTIGLKCGFSWPPLNATACIILTPSLATSCSSVDS
jgi:hypothetical protein